MLIRRSFSAALLVVLLSLRSTLLQSDFGAISLAALAFTIVSTLLVVRTAELGVWSSGFWYILVLACFHLGLAIPMGLGYPVDRDQASYAAEWFGPTSYRVEATYLSTLAVTAFACGYVWIHSTTKSRTRRTPGSGTTEASFGLILTIVGIFGLLWTIVSNDAGALFRLTRGAYIEGAANSGLGALAGFLIAFGGLFLVVAPSSTRRRIGFALLLSFAGWALLVGARSLVLYPALAMLIAAARVRPMPRPRVAILSLIGGLILVSLVGTYRTAGLAGTDLALSDANPLSGLTEMGGSIRPLIENLNYAHVLNETPSRGVTYAGPALRAYERAAGLPRPEGTADLRLAGNELRQRIEGGYQVGYSAVAEAYRNFRTPGVLGIFLLFGFILARLDSRRWGSRPAAVMTAVVFYALTYHVRQPSIQVIPLTIVGAILVWLCITVGEPKSRKDVKIERDPSHAIPQGKRVDA